MGRRDTGFPPPRSLSVAAKLRIPLPVVVATRQRASVVQRRSFCIRLKVDGLRSRRANRCVVVLVVKWIRLDGTVGHLHVILVALGWHSAGSCSTSGLHVPIAPIALLDAEAADSNDDDDQEQPANTAKNRAKQPV